MSCYVLSYSIENRIMKIIVSSILIVVSMLMSCTGSNPPNNTVQDLPLYQVNLEKYINNLKSVPLSSIGHKIEYIPLETNPSCMLKDIRQIALSDSFIFVSDINKLIQFDRKGKLIRQIGSQGRGPGEYMAIWDFSIDNRKGIIYISFTVTHELLKFDFSGKFIKPIELSFRPYNFILKDTNSLMFHMNNIPDPLIDTVYSWHITDKDGNTMSRIRNNVKRVRTPGYSVPQTPLYMFNSAAHFMEFGIDTLYFFNKSKKEPYALLNLGSLKMDIDPDILNQELANKLNQKFWILSIIEDRENMYLNLVRGLGGPLVSCLYNKHTSEAIILKDNSFKNDLDGVIPFWPKKIYQDSILVDYTSAFKLLKFINTKLINVPNDTGINNLDQLEELKNKLTDISNPVLMVLQ
jgi:hypothetical protein